MAIPALPQPTMPLAYQPTSKIAPAFSAANVGPTRGVTRLHLPPPNPGKPFWIIVLDFDNTMVIWADKQKKSVRLDLLEKLVRLLNHPDLRDNSYLIISTGRNLEAFAANALRDYLIPRLEKVFPHALIVDEGIDIHTNPMRRRGGRRNAPWTLVDLGNLLRLLTRMNPEHRQYPVSFTPWQEHLRQSFNWDQRLVSQELMTLFSDADFTNLMGYDFPETNKEALQKSIRYSAAFIQWPSEMRRTEKDYPPPSIKMFYRLPGMPEHVASQSFTLLSGDSSEGRFRKVFLPKMNPPTTEYQMSAVPQLQFRYEPPKAHQTKRQNPMAIFIRPGEHCFEIQPLPLPWPGKPTIQSQAEMLKDIETEDLPQMKAQIQRHLQNKLRLPYPPHVFDVPLHNRIWVHVHPANAQYPEGLDRLEAIHFMVEQILRQRQDSNNAYVLSGGDHVKLDKRLLSAPYIGENGFRYVVPNYSVGVGPYVDGSDNPNFHSQPDQDLAEGLAHQIKRIQPDFVWPLPPPQPPYKNNGRKKRLFAFA